MQMFDGSVRTDMPHGLPVVIGDLMPIAQRGGFPGACAESTLARLPLYNHWKEELSHLAKSCELDVILQLHLPPAPPMPPGVVSSQQRVVRILEQQNPDVVVVEGWDLDRCTPASMRAHTLEQSRRMGSPITDAMYDMFIQWMRPYSSTFLYIDRHPQAIVVGAEDEAVHLLQGYMANDETQHYSHDSPFMSIVRLRSVIALYRALDAARTHHARHAALVIGVHHGPEIAMMMKAAGIKGRIFDTTQ